MALWASWRLETFLCPAWGRQDGQHPLWDTGVPGWGIKGNLGFHGVPTAFSLLWVVPCWPRGQWHRGVWGTCWGWAGRVGSLSLNAENIKHQTHHSPCWHPSFPSHEADKSGFLHSQSVWLRFALQDSHCHCVKLEMPPMLISLLVLQ